ncbi:MAG TPA: peptidase domain-containing ABC transporter [Burkholderiaceae bacterium]|nr:peptidase domain-containing ABC transporter [Burkholderiaceae bacterium]
MSAENDAQREALAAEGDFAHDPTLWIVPALCALFSRTAPGPAVLRRARQHSADASSLLTQLLAATGFASAPRALAARDLPRQAFPLVVFLRGDAGAPDSAHDVSGLVLAADATQVLLAERHHPPRQVPLEVFADRFTGQAIAVADAAPAVTDPDAISATARDRQFGFRWFVPELLKHKPIWREVVIASLVIQVLALALPLFTQAIIDKVVVHRTQSTLITLAVAMGVFTLFTGALTWVRQYLVLVTGNRVDAVLGGSVWDHLLRLPLPYFAHRPTGVIAARLHGIETIREFLASAAVTLILDLPFLLIFIGIMFWYSVTLTLVVLAIIAVIVTLSLLVAPIFQRRLNEQFLRGARHQAFVTEYVAGMETVKSLQLEPQLNDRYATLLAAYLDSGLRTKQLANTYNTVAGTLEQGMTLLILALGAWIVMTTDMTTSGAFTIGMLVAFQMFAQRVSQPMLRLVGLWQQFQQARLSVDRLGDLMNAPAEPYTEHSRRDLVAQAGEIRIEQLAFRYGEDLPLLYERLSFRMAPGTVTAMMGPSGCGKSTLAKLLQGFYLPTHGAIRLDGVDARHLSANELRSYFGVVPQETLLFSGSVRDNLLLANPQASFEEMVAACKVAQIHDVIEQLPKGYDSELGERGTGLSGGQKQRLAIARALLKHPKILIFDEAIANLDAPTAEEFIRTVNTLHGRVTILFITHALPRSLKVDQVVRLGPNPEVLTAVPPGREPAVRTRAAARTPPATPEGVP